MPIKILMLAGFISGFCLIGIEAVHANCLKEEQSSNQKSDEVQLYSYDKYAIDIKTCSDAELKTLKDIFQKELNALADAAKRKRNTAYLWHDVGPLSRATLNGIEAEMRERNLK